MRSVCVIELQRLHAAVLEPTKKFPWRVARHVGGIVERKIVPLGVSMGFVVDDGTPIGIGSISGCGLDSFFVPLNRSTIRRLLEAMIQNEDGKKIVYLTA